MEEQKHTKMSGVPKREIMTPDEMRVYETRAGRLYSQTADHGLVVAEIVSNLANELANLPQKIDLRDTQKVADIAVAYADACARAGTICNKTGFCRAMGMTRQGVDWFVSHHPEEPSAELLTLIFDSFAEALNNASLAAAVHPIVSIFLSKAIYGYSDTLKIEASSAKEPFEDKPDVAAIMAKYEGLPDGGLPD